MAAGDDAVLDAEIVRAAEFRAALRRFIHRTEVATARHGLTLNRYNLLLQIRAAPGGRSNVTRLAELLQLGQSTVTELVQRAVDAGLVARQPSREDARVVHLSLTEEGERRLVAALRDLQADRDALAETFAAADERFREMQRTRGA